eukprot:scaffold10190_cov294-Chaetoceros_neogracile.AAC.17
MTYVNCTTADNGFYTIQSARDDDEDRRFFGEEVAALLAVTEQAGSTFRPNTSLSRSFQPNKFTPAGSGAPPQSIASTFRPPSHSPFQLRPNADPELRKQERLLAHQSEPAKKCATGIPMNFLNIPPPAQATEDDEGGDGTKL